MARLGFLLVLLGAIITLPTQADPKLYVFDCGYLATQDITAFGLGNHETNVRELFVPCYLIEHEKGRMLWDGGLPLAIAGRGMQQDPSGFSMQYERSIIDQLADMSVALSDIDMIAFSHFHWDHVGAANAFKNSHLLIQQTEYDAAFLNADSNPVFNPALYNELHNSSKTLLNGDHDVFDDGSVTIISAPGHTPGHQTLLIKLKNTGPIMLSGDLYHFEASRRLKRTPTFNTNAEQTLAAMARVEQVIEETGATLWIEHNLALAKTLKMAPAYYD